MLRILSEQTLDITEELCDYFEVWQKAFDYVNWTKQMQILDRNVLPGKKQDWSANCAWISVKLQAYQGESRNMKIGWRVWQKCRLSPILLNLHSEYLTKEALEGFGDFKVGGQIFRTVIYATGYGMEVNMGKTTVMRISRQPSPIKIKADKKQLKNVEYFNYLGSMITNDKISTC